MKPTVQDEDMEDDLAAEEENKLINEVGFPSTSSRFVPTPNGPFFRSTKYGTRYRSTALNTLSNCNTLAGKRTHHTYMTWSSHMHSIGQV
jgi:hypothetical protein